MSRPAASSERDNQVVTPGSFRRDPTGSCGHRVSCAKPFQVGSCWLVRCRALVALPEDGMTSSSTLLLVTTALCALVVALWPSRASSLPPRDEDAGLDAGADARLDAGRDGSNFGDAGIDPIVHANRWASSGLPPSQALPSSSSRRAHPTR
jgi:hypothetical protein